MAPVVVHCEWIVAPGGVVRRDTDIFVNDGIIDAIGPAGSFDQVAGAAICGGAGYAALPGTINAHHHGRATSTELLGVPDGPLENWIFDLLGVPSSDPGAEAQVIAANLLRNGSTGLMQMQSTGARNGEQLEAELRSTLEVYSQMGIRATIAADVRDGGLPVIVDTRRFLNALPSHLARALQEIIAAPLRLEVVTDVVASIRGDIQNGRYPGTNITLGPVGHPWVSPQLLDQVGRWAAVHDAPIQSHILQTTTDRDLALRMYGTGSVGGFQQAGLLNHRLSLAHGLLLSADDMDLLAHASTSVVVCPSSCLRILAGMANIGQLLGSGVNVALGTDSMSMHAPEDLFGEARMAQGLMRTLFGHDHELSDHEMFRMLCEAGANVLGDQRLGRLQPGSPADIVVVDVSHSNIATDLTSTTLLGRILSNTRQGDIRMVLTSGQVREFNAPSPSPAPIAYTRPDQQALEVLSTVREYLPGHYRSWAGAKDQHS